MRVPSHHMRLGNSLRLVRNNSSFSQLTDILSKMKVLKRVELPQDITRFRNSDMFKYATSKKYNKGDVQSKHLQTWAKLGQKNMLNLSSRMPLNGFEEMIRLTDEGKLWLYPIDNEQGLEKEKSVPFEEHIFLDEHLKDFPKNENIRAFMELVIMGLSKNPYIDVERKKKIIEYYKNYFESQRDTYRQAGFDIDSND